MGSNPIGGFCACLVIASASPKNFWDCARVPYCDFDAAAQILSPAEKEAWGLASSADDGVACQEGSSAGARAHMLLAGLESLARARLNSLLSGMSQRSLEHGSAVFLTPTFLREEMLFLQLQP